MIRHMKKCLQNASNSENKGRLMLKSELYYKLVEYIVNNDFQDYHHITMLKRYMLL